MAAATPRVSETPAGNGNLRIGFTGRDQIDQIVFKQQRRMREDRERNVRLVARQCMHDHLRRVFGGCEYLGERAANKRRRIVQQHDHRAFRGGQIISRQIGVKIGARQRRSGFRPLPGRRLAHPLQELTNDHWQTDAT